MRLTKSQFVLRLAEDIYEQDDLAILDKVQRETGLDLLDENEFSDEQLQLMAELGMDTLHAGYQAAKGLIKPHLATVGQHVAAGVSKLGSLATAHPAIAGAAAVGAGALAALRLRQKMKAKAAGNVK